MNLLTFLMLYALLVVIAGLIISGFYITTRGEKTLLPDGTVRLTGKIFKRWSLFWERARGSQRYYVCGKELKEKHRWLQECNPALAAKLGPTPNLTSLEILDDLDSTEQKYIREVLQCDIEIDSGPYLFLYVDVPVYYFPEWVRYPLSQCPPCMASTGGTLVYWTIAILAPNMYGWTNHPELASILCWIFFCCALAAVNKYFHNLIGA